MLHITNGDSTAGSLRHSGLGGDVLPWRDVLHEGPVPASLSLDELRPIRARFIVEVGMGSADDVLADFAERDATLTRFREHDEVLLWFEHDLYDQLQLIQLLDYFSQQNLGSTHLSLICINAFPGIKPFFGLGQLTPEQLASLYPVRQPISPAMLRLGHDAWDAFRSPDPTALEELLRTDTTILPFLAAAFLRHLEQFPATDSGLSRTERQILQAVAVGARTPVEIFLVDQRQEDAPFMGDWPLWMHLSRLCQVPQPLLALADDTAFTFPQQGQSPDAFSAQHLALTPQGHAILAGQADWIRLSGGIERWLGGVHLLGGDAVWRWDRQTQRLIAP